MTAMAMAKRAGESRFGFLAWRPDKQSLLSLSLSLSLDHIRESIMMVPENALFTAP